MESQKNVKFSTIIERIESQHKLTREDISRLKDTINMDRSVELILTDIKCCVEEILEKVGKSSATEGIISIVLDSSSRLMKEILQKIVEILKSCDLGTFSFDIEVQLNENITHCMEILDLLVELLKYIVKNSPYESDTVKDLPVKIAAVLMDVFSHCKNSESLYSTYFHQIGKKITLVFKKCHELQCYYFQVITDHIHFYPMQSQHEDVILQALDIIVDIGEVVIVLDVKTMAEQWKGYTKLCEKYSVLLEDKEIHVKATTLLCDQIQDRLQSMVNNEKQDPKILMICLKSSNFLLKLVVKLCETFGSSISRHSQHILQLLRSIQHYSPPHLIHLGVGVPVMEGVRSHITVGAEPLLYTMVQYEAFRQIFLDHTNKSSDEPPHKLGDLLLTVAIMRTLLQSTEDVRDCWTSSYSPENNIICILLNMITLCHDDFLKGLKFDTNDTSGGKVSLYDHVLCHCAALTVSCKDISLIEETLLTAVLQDGVWGALFSVDLWMIIARYSSVDFRYNQLVYLIEMFRDFCNENINMNQTPQKSNLTHLIRNLFNLLPIKFKYQALMKFPISEYLQVWTTVGLDQLPVEYKDEIEILVMTTISTLKSVLSGCLNAVNENEFNKMLNCLNLISTIQEDVLNKLSLVVRSDLKDNVYEAWLRLFPRFELQEMLTDKEYTVQDSHWVDSYFMSLCDVTCNLLQVFNNQQLIMILGIILSYIQRTQSCNKISTLNLLKAVTHLKINNDHLEKDVVSNIAKLFECLLQDSSAVIRILSLEVFSYLATNTQNETIVSETVKGNKNLKDKVTNFFLKKFDKVNSSVYVSSCNKFTHKCIVKSSQFSSQSPDFDFGNIDDLFKDEDSVDTPNKKIKLDSSPDEQIVQSILERMTDDAKSISYYKDKIKSSEDLKIKLNNICETLRNLTN